MRRNLTTLIAFSALITIAQFALAEDTDTETDTELPFSIGEPTVQGNGCPEGTYNVALSPDGTELSILFSDFTAMTDPTHTYDFSNCNIAIPITVSPGITVGLVGIDYRGLAFIPTKGLGMLTREYFFAGSQGQRRASSISVYNMPYEFFYDDDLTVTAWTNCGDDSIARANATIFVSRPADSLMEAMMSVFSEDWEVSILFHLVWQYC